MVERSVFDRLVNTLSSAERRDLLDRIQRSLVLSSEPLQADAEDPPVADIDEELRRLGPFRSFWLRLKALLTGKDRRVLVKETLLKKLQSRLERQARGLVDFRAGLFLNRMYEELTALRDCVSLFREPLQQAIEHRRHDFFAFLAGMMLPEIQERLALETDPFTMQGEYLPDGEEGVRQEMIDRFERVLESIPEVDVDRLVIEAAALRALHKLSSQPFEAMLACFEPLPGGGGRVGAIFRLKRYLPALADSLLEAYFPPSPEGLRALFLFFNRERLDGADFDLEERLVRYFGRTEEALSGIRRFNSRVPMCGLIQAASGDPGYTPRPSNDGEGWLDLFREFWKRRLEETWQAYRRSRLRERLTAELLEMIGLEQLPEIEGYRTGGGRYPLSASALLGIQRGLLPKVYRPLRLILLQGEFFKPGNRHEFAESFNRLERIGAGLDDLDRDLSIADQQVLTRIQNAEELLESLIRLLGGILRGQPGAPYDTLVNMSTLGGSENRKLVDSWRAILDQLSRLLQLLRSIKDLERAEGRD